MGLFGSIHKLPNVSQNHHLSNTSLLIPANNLSFSACVKLGLFLIHSLSLLSSSIDKFDKSQLLKTSNKSSYNEVLSGLIHNFSNICHIQSIFHKSLSVNSSLIYQVNVSTCVSEKSGTCSIHFHKFSKSLSDIVLIESGFDNFSSNLSYNSSSTNHTNSACSHDVRLGLSMISVLASINSGIVILSKTSSSDK
ncbi:MAG: hypothetical protein U9Q66_02250 [Patescibacteria group bacterium]|nr:hypothetical protein [Patescibacteria group bacterium]